MSPPLRVFVEVRWESESGRFGSTLVFDTIRVGFPTAEIVIVDNGSAPLFSADLSALRGKIGATVIARPGLTHGLYIEDVIKAEAASGLRTPIVFCDTDMTFEQSMEETELFDGTLFAGPLQPEIPLVDGRMAPRIHPCLFWVKDPVAAAEVIEKWERRFFLDSLLASQVVRDEKGVLLYDTLSALTCLCPELVQHLTWDGFMHMGLGTRPERLAAVGLAAPVENAIRRAHEEAARPRPVQWEPPAGNVRWLYGSGLLDGDDGHQYPVFVSTFWAATEWKPVSHIGVLDRETGKFWPAALPGPPGDFQVVPGEEGTVFGVPMTDGETQRRVSLGWMGGTALLGDRAVKVSGPAWVEEEGGNCGDKDSWIWVSVRLDDGRRIMFSEANGTAKPIVSVWKGRKHLGSAPATLVPAKKWTSPSGSDYGTAWTLQVGDETFSIVAAVDDQKVSDPNFFCIAYWEGYCQVLRDGEDVGHAWVEQVRPGWDVPNETVELIDDAMMGDKHAADFAKMLSSISQLADDFADGDATGAPGMTDLLSWVAFDLQKNPFYVQHRADLDPVLEMCLLYWEASDDWKTSPLRETRMWGFVMREIMEMAIARAALLIGGRDHARGVIRGMQAHYHVKRGDSFDGWMASEEQHNER